MSELVGFTVQRDRQTVTDTDRQVFFFTFSIKSNCIRNSRKILTDFRKTVEDGPNIRPCNFFSPAVCLSVLDVTVMNIVWITYKFHQISSVYAYAVVQNLLTLTTGKLRNFVAKSACPGVTHLSAEDGKVFVAMVTSSHDNLLDATAVDMPPLSSSSAHHQHQPQQLQRSNATERCTTSAPNFCPDLFLNTCDDTMTSLSSSSSMS